jgi:hypothetical protein
VLPEVNTARVKAYVAEIERLETACVKTPLPATGLVKTV